NEENFIKLKNTARKTIDFIKSILKKYKKSINIKEKDMEKCSKIIFSITEVFLMMENINFETNKFSSKTLDEVKELYRSQDMKENLEFKKESIKKILYR
ncbi:MAG: TetR/AcrR family transcriptional regulator, partial [Fusobacterium periodonticum]|nr:TetR/AcrR family transcriptional regulator [Fusobacterium periodonticum]